MLLERIREDLTVPAASGIMAHLEEEHCMERRRAGYSGPSLEVWIDRLSESLENSMINDACWENYRMGYSRHRVHECFFPSRRRHAVSGTLKPRMGRHDEERDETLGSVGFSQGLNFSFFHFECEAEFNILPLTKYGIRVV